MTQHAGMSCGDTPQDDPGLHGAVYREGAAHFRVWAPRARQVDVLISAPAAGRFPLQRNADGYFTGMFGNLAPGALYMYALDGGTARPDPCSRFQPEGPHGPSMLIEPAAYSWTDTHWRGVHIEGQVLYELHIGTFTPQGTFDAARERLPYLRELGVTVLELMPLSECPGRWNWGYDGVQLFAPYHVYGDPQSLKRFIDSAHGLGLGVILDAVFNHLGPDGNYLNDFSSDYQSRRYRTEWGAALNFDAANSAAVRGLILANACYWIGELHMDGFRFDATQAVFDSHRPHILAELTQHSRQQAGQRQLIFIAENEPQRAEQLLPVDRGGFGLDAMWNDDFHHSARVALTGIRDGYYCDYTGRAQELLSSIRHGFLFQGQYYSWQKQRRGSPLRHQPAWSCVHFLQNHDQVANAFKGLRLHQLCSPSSYRAMTALLLLTPRTPLLFMGQEFLSSRPFPYFADHREDLREAVFSGRRKFLTQFRAYAGPDSQDCIPDPAQESTFRSAQLDWSEVQANAAAWEMHRSLLKLRRHDPVLSQQRLAAVDGATLSEHALLLRWCDDESGDRLLVVNLGPDIVTPSLAEPLLAAPAEHDWMLLWSSEDPRFGGCGTVMPVEDGRWRIPANCALLLQASVTNP